LKGPRTLPGQEVAILLLPRCQRGGVSDAQWGLELSPNASRTRSADLEEVRAEVRRLDEKFNFIQSSLLAMMAKLGIPVEK
jgi:hypothetical protein